MEVQKNQCGGREGDRRREAPRTPARGGVAGPAASVRRAAAGLPGAEVLHRHLHRDRGGDTIGKCRGAAGVAQNCAPRGAKWPKQNPQFADSARQDASGRRSGVRRITRQAPPRAVPKNSSRRIGDRRRGVLPRWRCRTNAR